MGRPYPVVPRDRQPKSSGHTRRSEASTAGPAGSRDGGSGARRLRRPLAGSGSAGFDGKALAGPSALSVSAAACSRGSTRWRPRLPRVDAGAEWRPLSSGRKVKGGPRRRRRSGLWEPVAGFLGAPARVPPPLPSGLELGGGWGRAAGLPSVRCCCLLSWIALHSSPSGSRVHETRLGFPQGGCSLRVGSQGFRAVAV